MDQSLGLDRTRDETNHWNTVCSLRRDVVGVTSAESERGGKYSHEPNYQLALSPPVPSAAGAGWIFEDPLKEAASEVVANFYR